jgi:hypothetical protein
MGLWLNIIALDVILDNTDTIGLCFYLTFFILKMVEEQNHKI